MSKSTFSFAFAAWLASIAVPATFATGINSNLFANHFGIPFKNASFDYLVIGGGTAGIAIATRLAEDPANTVALVEAGGMYDVDNGNTSTIPGLGLGYDVVDQSTVRNFPQVDWEFLTTPQVPSSGARIHYVRGRTLGGSSALNNLVYQRGTTQSYQQWADMVGDDSYEFENFLPFFRKSVHYTGPDTSKRPSNATVPPPTSQAYSKKGGPLTVSFQNFPLAIDTWMRRAFNQVGLKEIEDFVSGKLLGHQYTPLETHPVHQTRASSYSTFLSSYLASGRTNLQIYPRTLAKKVLFDGRVANGVEVAQYGKPFHLSARKEVILSSGAFQSPQLLMVSGIGPQSKLEELEIPVLLNLPGVGQNMWDHVLFGVQARVNLQGSASLNDPQYAVEARLAFLQNATGVLTSAGFDYIGWEKVPSYLRANFTARAQRNLKGFPADWPEIEYVTGDGQQFPSADSYLSLLATLVAPLSRGNVTIRSRDTVDAPIINPNWLSDETDVEVAIAAVKRLQTIIGSQSLRPIRIGGILPSAKDLSSDDAIRAFVKQTAATLYHAACTCAMGKADDPMAVIDSKARVHGVHRLRVVDASSFPLLPPGHPTATIYALAEKIANDILQEKA